MTPRTAPRTAAGHACDNCGEPMVADPQVIEGFVNPDGTGNGNWSRLRGGAGMTRCINCGRRVWWWQRQGWRYLSVGSDTAVLRWHGKCRHRP